MFKAEHRFYCGLNVCKTCKLNFPDEECYTHLLKNPQFVEDEIKPLMARKEELELHAKYCFGRHCEDCPLQCENNGTGYGCSIYALKTNFHKTHQMITNAVRNHATDAGTDLTSTVTVTIPPRGNVAITSNNVVTVPEGCVGLVCNRSGLNFKHNVTLHGVGVIDYGYTAPVGILLYNDSDVPYTVNEGDRIAQVVILPIVIPTGVPVLNNDVRGEKGFGSSGK